MTDFYSQNRCVCSTRSHGPLLCAFCLSFHFKVKVISSMFRRIMEPNMWPPRVYVRKYYPPRGITS